jgi:hypothetical protein
MTIPIVERVCLSGFFISVSFPGPDGLETQNGVAIVHKLSNAHFTVIVRE